MTSPEKSAFLKQASVAVALVALGATLMYVVLAFPLVGPDDRPPIIVSNGSVHVRLAPGPNPRGRFVKGVDSGPTTTWHHENGNGGGPPPGKMHVLVSGVGGSASGNCTTESNFFVEKVSLIDVIYSVPNLPDRHLTLSVQNNNRLEIVVDSAANPPPPPTDYAVDFDAAGAMLKSVTLWRQQLASTCTFGGPTGPEILVLQRH